MTWSIDSEPRPGADRIRATWTGLHPVVDASLEGGEGVARTSVGGSTRGELSRFDDKPLVGIFRWTPETTRPVAILTWRTERDGQVFTEEVPLG